MTTLTINNLSKTYANGTQALRKISLTIPTGMYGLLGPNGAGKSTLMRTLATLQSPDEGEIHLGNINLLQHPHAIRQRLGYLPQEFGLYPRVTAIELMHHIAIMKGVSHKAHRVDIVNALLHRTNLYEYRHKRLGGYSGGMKQRFGIAQALLTSPELIIVDEPTAGLDPEERDRFHNLLCDLGQNTIVILSTHIVDDVRELCSNMAIINRGEVLLTGHPQTALDNLKGKIYSKIVTRQRVADYRQRYQVIAERLVQGKPQIHIYSDTSPGNEFIPIEADLRDVYFHQLYR